MGSAFGAVEIFPTSQRSILEADTPTCTFNPVALCTLGMRSIAVRARKPDPKQFLRKWVWLAKLSCASGCFAEGQSWLSTSSGTEYSWVKALRSSTHFAFENGCTDAIEAKWMLAVVPLHYGGRLLGRSANCRYLLGRLRHKAERNRVDCAWFVDGAEMCPICIVFRKAQSRQTTKNEIGSRCDLFDVYLGRGRPRVCFTGNVHICSCSSMYRNSGVSLRQAFRSIWSLIQCSTFLLFQIIFLVGSGQTCSSNPLHIAGPVGQLSHLSWTFTNMQRIWWWCKRFPYWKSWRVSSPSPGLFIPPQLVRSGVYVLCSW